MTEQFQFTDKLKRNLFIMMGIGLVGLVLAFLVYGENNHSRFWSNVLVNAYYFTGISLFGMFFVCANQLGYSGWITLIKRIMLSLSGFLLIGGPLLLLICALTWVGGHNLYDHWTHMLHAKHMPENFTTKAIFLNLPFWSGRIVLYVVLWILFSKLLTKFFGREDLADPKVYKKSKLLAAAYIVVFAVTESFVSWDMIMSIDPHWYSTLFGWYNFASYGCAGFAFTILLIIYLKSKGHLNQVNENHIQDLGKFLFGFSIFWTYLWFSQFMLQWYANIPEDTIYWTKRFGAGFKFTIFLALAINFLLPLLVLMTRGAKRNFKVLCFAAVVIIFGHYVDFYNMVMLEPNTPVSAHHEAGAEHHASNKSIEQILYAENKAVVAEHKEEAVVADSKATEETAHAEPATEATHAAAEGHKTEGHEVAAAHGEHAAGHGEEHEAVKNYANLGLVELMIFTGFIGAFLFMFFLELAKRPLVPENDPYLQESIKHQI
jgi:hypothetical protein